MLLLLSLLCSLVEIHSQTAPYLSFMGQALPNNSFVDLSLVGSDALGGLQCHTDLPTCCSGNQGLHRGDWYFPDGTKLTLFGDGDFYESRGAQRVNLRRRNGVTSPSGLYRCDIPTVAVHDDTDTSVRDTIYVGAFTSSGGDFRDVRISFNNGVITCISTGGPVTTVTWTRNSVVVTEGTETVLDDPVTAQYTHTLTPSGSALANYVCSVANNKPSSASAAITVLGESLSINLGLPSSGATWIYLPWDSSQSEVNLYSITWRSDTSVGCPGGNSETGQNSVNNTLNGYNITELEEDTRYIISVSVMNTGGQTSSVTATATTLEAVPSAAPSSLNVSAVTSFSITVEWERVPYVDRNGDILSHFVRYGEVNSSSIGEFSVPGSETTLATISSLLPSTDYWIEVAAVNSAGPGNYSTSIVQETDGVDCGDPPMLENGRLSNVSMNTTYNSIVTYECIDGYFFQESNTSRMCLASGNWSDNDIFCRVLPASGSVCGDISCWISAGTLAGILCGVAALITVVVCVVAACVFRRRLRKHKASKTLLYLSSKNTDTQSDAIALQHIYTTPGDLAPPPSPVQQMQIELKKKNMLFPKRDLELGRVIGQGESGLVYRGYVKRGAFTELVAIKTGKALLAVSDKERLLKEVSHMLTFSHPNVMPLIGMSFDGETPLIIMPFMSKGNVLVHVRANRDTLYLTQSSDNKQVEAARKSSLGICYQISKGMSYLAKFKFVHRDLAARNCMIDDNDVIKVSDFGLTEDMYSSDYYRHDDSEAKKKEKMPIKWMAPESIETNIFDEKTDVWSFGVTCWEVLTCGGVPYAGVPATTLLRELRSGHRLDRPTNTACSDNIWAVVASCWSASPQERPTFSTLVNILTDLLDNDPTYIKLI